MNNPALKLRSYMPLSADLATQARGQGRRRSRKMHEIKVSRYTQASSFTTKSLAPYLYDTLGWRRVAYASATRRFCQVYAFVALR